MRTRFPAKASRLIREIYRAHPDWSVSLTRGNHLRFRGPNGAVVITGSTPGDHRTILAVRAQIERSLRPGAL
jgi:hypothetical protein